MGRGNISETVPALDDVGGLALRPFSQKRRAIKEQLGIGVDDPINYPVGGRDLVGAHPCVFGSDRVEFLSSLYNVKGTGSRA